MSIETPMIERPEMTTALESAGTRAIWQCDICDTEMLDLHCKLRCTNCGFMRDCSDP